MEQSEGMKALEVRGKQAKNVRKFFLIIVVAVIVSALVWQGFMQKPVEEVPTPKGLLPTWKVGENWTYLSTAGHTYDFTMRGEYDFGGVPIWRLEGTIDPPINGWASNVRWDYEKSTLRLLVKVIWGADRDETTYFRRTSLDNLWPLLENKSYVEEVQIERFGVVGIEGWQDPIVSVSYEVRVEAFETVAVQAGEFECFRISTRAPENTLIEERWYSDAVKNFVKIADYQTGENLELTDFELPL
jgi:hypothetical protein